MKRNLLALAAAGAIALGGFAINQAQAGRGHGHAFGLEERPERPLGLHCQLAPEAADFGCQLTLGDRSCGHDSRKSLSRTKFSMRNIATRTMFVQSGRREPGSHRNDWRNVLEVLALGTGVGIVGLVVIVLIVILILRIL